MELRVAIMISDSYPTRNPVLELPWRKMAYRQVEQRHVFLNEVLDGLKDLLVVLGFKVSDNIADVSFKLRSVCEALLHFCLVVIT